MDKLSLEDLQHLHKDFDLDILNIWSYENSAESRDSIGGTSKQRVKEQIEEIKIRSLAILNTHNKVN